MYNFVYSFSIIMGTFSLSTITSFIILYVNKYPFINTKYKHEKRIDRLFTILSHIPLLLLESILFMYIVSDNIVGYDEHTIIQSIHSIVIYCAFIEVNYYLCHKCIDNYYYLDVDKKHPHNNIIVYPFDTFYMTSLHDTTLVISLGLPIFFIEITTIEHFLVLYMYITSAYLSHSTLCWKHHDINDQFIYCNYYVLFPMFDICFGTYKIE